jgi:hypothetical protein
MNSLPLEQIRSVFSGRFQSAELLKSIKAFYICKTSISQDRLSFPKERGSLMKKALIGSAIIIAALALSACNKPAEPAASTPEVAAPAADANAAAPAESSAPIKNAATSSAGDKI